MRKTKKIHLNFTLFKSFTIFYLFQWLSMTAFLASHSMYSNLSMLVYQDWQQNKFKHHLAGFVFNFFFFIISSFSVQTPFLSHGIVSYLLCLVEVNKSWVNNVDCVNHLHAFKLLWTFYENLKVHFNIYVIITSHVPKAPRFIQDQLQHKDWFKTCIQNVVVVQASVVREALKYM